MSKVYTHPVTGIRSYVKFHPRDVGFGLPKQYLQDPATFVPVLDPEHKNFVQWGILAEDVLDTSSQGNPFAGSELHPIQQRMMTVQSLYYGTEERPEVQVSFTSPSPSPPFIPLVLDPSSTDL